MIANESNNYNRVVDYQLTEGTVIEPVTLAEAKSYARCLTGTAEDTLFNILISAARNSIEKFTGLSLVEKSVKVSFMNPAGYFELPYGPVTNDPVIKDSNGLVITPTVIGYDFPVIQDAFYDYATAEYTVGYTTIPVELKVAILDQITFLYENRGDNSDSATVCSKSQKVCQKYSRIPFFN